VEKIPSIENREKGVRYFNDKDLLERVKRIDLIRILKGERSITSTPINKVTFEQEFDKLKKNANFKAGVYSSSENISFEEAYKRAKEEEINEFQKRREIKGGGYDFKADEIKTYDKFRPENLIDLDEAVFPHEDWHAYSTQNSKYLQEIALSERQLDNLIKEEQVLTLNEKMIKKGAGDQKTEIIDSYTDEGLDKMLKYHLNDRDREDKFTAILTKEIELRRKKEILREKTKIPPDITATDEGFAFAVTRYYSGWNPENFDSYKNKTDPSLILKSRDLSEKLISIIGIESSKKFVLGVINEAFDKKTNAVKLLGEKISRKEFS
jgi:hypothetical protein